ncbi:MAG: hypothetical protein C4339_00420 [Nitrososphaerota archaeon]
MTWIRIGSPFRLPRLGSESFRKLMEAGVKYDRERRMFSVDDKTDLGLVSAILAAALGEEVEFELDCFICGNPAGCPTCVYLPFCDRRRVSRSCICETCLRKPDAYRLYVDKVKEALRSG